MFEQGPDLSYENKAYQKGFRVIAGIDEAGRGPLAGPVVAAACIFKRDLFLPVDDSKRLSEKKREELFKLLTEHPDVFYGIGMVDAEVIDEINILQATWKAMQSAVEHLPREPDFLLIDGRDLPRISLAKLGVIKGDQKSQSIAAASIIAKVTRDRLMRSYDATWPEYGFASHKGYGTQEHLKAIALHGPCPLHRRTFRHSPPLGKELDTI